MVSARPVEDFAFRTVLQVAARSISRVVGWNNRADSSFAESLTQRRRPCGLTRFPHSFGAGFWGNNFTSETSGPLLMTKASFPSGHSNQSIHRSKHSTLPERIHCTLCPADARASVPSGDICPKTTKRQVPVISCFPPHFSSSTPPRTIARHSPNRQPNRKVKPAGSHFIDICILPANQRACAEPILQYVVLS